jgi:hypothetical protein
LEANDNRSQPVPTGLAGQHCVLPNIPPPDLA